MADPVQCDECGAILAEDDLFCGECGAVRPPGTEVSQPAVDAPALAPPAPPPAPSPVAPSPVALSPVARYRALFIVLIVLGIVTCILALISFLVVGALPSDVTTPQEAWLLSGICCLLPVGVAGLGLLIAGVVVWRKLLRDQ
jgi:hypothetical protein